MTSGRGPFVCQSALICCRRAVAASLVALSLLAPTEASAQSRRPYTIQDLVALLRGGVRTTRILQLMRTDCIDFEVADEDSNLRAAGATDSLIEALKSVCTATQAAAPPAAAALTPRPDVLRAQLVRQNSSTMAEFRAMHAPGESVVWAVGTNGNFAVTTDGGATWRADSIPDGSDMLLAGVWARDAHTAFVVGTATDGGLARIYHTVDGGRTWTVQWERTGNGVFFDALRCWTPVRCMAFSDPVRGAFLIARTENGATWVEIAPEHLPPPLDNEVVYAASGTALATWGTLHAWIGTGAAARTRVLATTDGGTTWRVAETPLPGSATSAIFGIAFRDSLNGVAVGGDFQRLRERQQSVLRTSDGGRTWELAGAFQPEGVPYGIGYAPGGPTHGALLGVGATGVGISLDDGKTWIACHTEHYNTLAFASTGDVWVAGPEGRIARITFERIPAGATLSPLECTQDRAITPG